LKRDLSVGLPIAFVVLLFLAFLIYKKCKKPYNPGAIALKKYRIKYADLFRENEVN